jgi:hypothetical protein
VESAPSDSPEKPSAAGQIAFEARLTPEPQLASGGADAPAEPNPAKKENATAGMRIDAPAAGVAGQTEMSEEPSPRVEETQPVDDNRAPLAAKKPRPVSDVGKADAEGHSGMERKPAETAATASPATAHDTSAATAVRDAGIQDTASGPNRSNAAAPPPAETANRPADVQLAADPPKPAGAAREMRFAVGGGDQRVEVRVAERGGEVHVAVSTPDQRLAGSLRDDLPSLTAKLESAGLRTETWRGGPASGAGPERPAENTSRTQSQDSQDQPGRDGRRQQDDLPPQRPKRPADSTHPKDSRKDFQWHFTSLR